MSKKQDRIDFFNMLVTSTFEQWCDDNIDEGEKRTFHLLEFFPVIKDLYNSFTDIDDSSNVSELYCVLTELDKMKVFVTFNNEDGLYSLLVNEYTKYRNGNIKGRLTVESDKRIKIVFSKG